VAKRVRKTLERDYPETQVSGASLAKDPPGPERKRPKVGRAVLGRGIVEVEGEIQDEQGEYWMLADIAQNIYLTSLWRLRKIANSDYYTFQNYAAVYDYKLIEEKYLCIRWQESIIIPRNEDELITLNFAKTDKGYTFLIETQFTEARCKWAIQKVPSRNGKVQIYTDISYGGRPKRVYLGVNFARGHLPVEMDEDPVYFRSLSLEGFDEPTLGWYHRYDFQSCFHKTEVETANTNDTWRLRRFYWI